MPREYRAMRKTVYDLYVERDRLPWYFRATALVASWLVLAGYILFALIFTSISENIKVSRAALTSIAAAIFIIGYVAIAATAALSKSLLFFFDATLLPILTSSVLGLAAIVFNHALHKKFSVSDIYIIVPLVVASTSTIISTLLAGWVYYRIRTIRRSDNRRKVNVSREERHAWPGMSDAASTTELLPSNTSMHDMVIPEDEQQRQQLLRLLLRREAQRAPSPDAASSTYHIDLPSSLNGNDYLPVQNPNIITNENNLPGSATRFQLSKLLGGRSRSPAADSFKNPRERRREEIERGGSLGDISSQMATDQWTGLGIPMPYTSKTPGTPPAWNTST